MNCGELGITPGGVPQVITAARATAILSAHPPAGPVTAAWHDLASVAPAGS
jgi:hypothetical protein